MISFLSQLNQWALDSFGREWVEYFTSNTMNVVTERLNPFLWTYDCKALVVDIVQETPDVRTLVLKPNQHFAKPIAGQHIDVLISDDEGEHSRCYSLTRTTPDSIAITVKRQPGGRVSNWIHDNVQLGDVLKISQPRGRFVYEGQDKVLFICAGSGITPCYALMKDLLMQTPAAELSMFYRAPSPEQVIFSEWLREYSCCTISYSSNPVAVEAGLEMKLWQNYGNLDGVAVYLCGPNSFKDRVITYLKALNYDMSSLYVEHYVQFESLGTPQNASIDRTVFLKQQNKSFVIPSGEEAKTILEAAEANGISLEHGCRAGMCGTCKTKLVSGSVSGLQTGDAIYPCVCYPESAEVVIE